MREKKRNIREILTWLAVVAVFSAFAGQLVKLQLVEGEAFASKVNSSVEKTVSIRAARGEILDRNGFPLVTNRQGNSVVFESALFPPASSMDERVKIIDSLIKLFDSRQIPWFDNLPLEFDEEGKIVFAEKRESEIAHMKSRNMLNLNDYATAQNCMEALAERYHLKDYEPVQARKIASVCYEMKRQVFSISNPYTFAEDVPGELVAYIKENSAFYKGVEVEIVPYRVYTDGTIAPHILGMTGAINAEEYKQRKDKGYKINDVIGKNGIESAMEEELRGTDGAKKVILARDGKVETEIVRPPEPGRTVILTIDKDLQILTQESLERALKAEKTPVPSAGAVVVMNCRTGEILASASYPTYDISTYNKNYKQLSAAPAAPLWNRALLSTYEVGSTMKPSVAIAGLEEGLITKNSTKYCSGVYNYAGRNFKCEQYHRNRNLNVVYAIKDSCNVFFYDLGRQLGITLLNQYRTMLGFGQKTGVELNEAAGNLDSPEYRASKNQVWQDGFTIQSAIGQANNLCTPLQLTNYCATIANGGTLYQPHFVKSVRSADYSETYLEKTTVVKWETGISKSTMDIVKEGMLLVGTEGYSRAAFANLPVKAASKTGTSQVVREINGSFRQINNGILISYAPGEAPELAVAIIAEGFPSGARLSKVAADIYDYYFSNTEKLQVPQRENILLG